MLLSALVEEGIKFIYFRAMITFQKAWQSSFTEKPYRIGLHVLFWVVYICVISLSSSIRFHNEAGAEGGKFFLFILFVFIANFLIISVPYYILIHTTYPFVYRRKNFWKGFAWLLGCLMVYSQLYFFSIKGSIYLKGVLGFPEKFADMSFEKKIAEGGYWGFFGSPLVWIPLIIAFIVLMSIPVVARVFRDHIRLQGAKNSLQEENMKLEMAFLKAQIHPHFLFNTLNNIYSLIVDKESEKSAEMVSGLSSLLRYALYDGKAELILLEKEVKMLKDFIGLEAVRSDHVQMEIRWPESLPEVKIPPFLLLPLVENAYKHGVNSQLERSCLRITLERVHSFLILHVENDFDPEYREKNQGGLGLVNLRKRLDYYYGSGYDLNIREKGNHYSATLKLPLACQK